MTILYGIKNCDTVKKAKKWLEANDVEYSFHDFRGEGLTEAKVAEWLTKVDLSILLNKRGTTYRQLDDATKESITLDSAPSLFAQNPTLIKRPVVEHQNEVSVGFKADDFATRFK